MERLENADATETDAEAPAEDVARPAEIDVVPVPAQVGKPSAPSGAGGGPPRKRKAPVVNRRGPSEIDKAIRMSHMGPGRAPTTARNLSEGATSRGTIIRIDRTKGFGFVVDSAGEHRFFHRSSVQDNGFEALKEQQLVEFEAHNEERGLRALNVRAVDPSSRPPKTPQRPQNSQKPQRGQGWRSDLSPFRGGAGSPSGRKWKI